MLGKTFNISTFFWYSIFDWYRGLYLRLSNWLSSIFSSFSSLSSFVTHYLVFKVQLIECLAYHIFMIAMVEMRRIELLTPCLQGRCSPSWATPPNSCWYFVKTTSAYTKYCLRCLSLSEQELLSFSVSLLVGLSGLEPPTSRLSGVRSNRLSYRPIGSMLDSYLSFPHFYIQYSYFNVHN